MAAEPRGLRCKPDVRDSKSIHCGNLFHSRCAESAGLVPKKCSVNQSYFSLDAGRNLPPSSNMATAEYNAKLMRMAYQYLPYVGAFLLVSQLLGLGINAVRFATGEKIQAQFVSKVRFARSGSSTRGIGQTDCAYNFRLPDVVNVLYHIHGCKMAIGANPLPGDAQPVVIYQKDPPLIVSKVSFSLDWMRLFTASVGLLMLALPRPLLRRYGRQSP